MKAQRRKILGVGIEVEEADARCFCTVSVRMEQTKVMVGGLSLGGMIGLLCFTHALQQLPQRHLGGSRNFDFFARLLPLVEVCLSQLTGCISAGVWCLGQEARGAVSTTPSHVLEGSSGFANFERVVVVIGALHEHGRVFAGYAFLGSGGARAALIAPWSGDAALCLAPGDAAAQLTDFIDDMDAVWGLWVLGSDVEVEVASKAGGGECLAAKGAVLVFCSLELRFSSRARRRGWFGFAHGVGRRLRPVFRVPRLELSSK